jgi:hypothetical protein
VSRSWPKKIPNASSRGLICHCGLTARIDGPTRCVIENQNEETVRSKTGRRVTASRKSPPYLEELAVEVRDDKGDHAQWNQAKVGTLEPLFIVKGSLLGPL